jgi:hypothetical protein
MKDQYFGDINDYRKYGLLRTIMTVTKLRLLVAWMLTPDDDRNDGNLVSYLDDPCRWEDRDPILFRKLRALLANEVDCEVGLIEKSDLLWRSPRLVDG